MGSKLILVEGLTGSGKSIMAHFIARQLQYNGFPASWVHEGEVPHPVLAEMDSNIDSYQVEITANIVALRSQLEISGEIHVLEASFFNNLMETPWLHCVERSRIFEFADELQKIIEPLNPILVYLVQDDVAKALAVNFKRRGNSFKSYVIDFATSTPLAKHRGWEGYEGMVQFWREFSALMDALYRRFQGRKLRIDNTAGNWEKYSQQVLDYLGIPRVVEQGISQKDASRLVGTYQARDSGRVFEVRFEEDELSINVFLNVRTRLVRRRANSFLAEGWPFEISFEHDESIGASTLQIGGKDVDYLALVGTVAEKIAGQ